MNLGYWQNPYLTNIYMHFFNPLGSMQMQINLISY